VDFRLTDEQQLLRQTVREFAEAEIRPHVREWDDAQRFPSELVPKPSSLPLRILTRFDDDAFPCGGERLLPLNYATYRLVPRGVPCRGLWRNSLRQALHLVDPSAL